MRGRLQAVRYGLLLGATVVAITLASGATARFLLESGGAAAPGRSAPAPAAPAAAPAPVADGVAPAAPSGPAVAVAAPEPAAAVAGAAPAAAAPSGSGPVVARATRSVRSPRRSTAAPDLRARADTLVARERWAEALEAYGRLHAREQGDAAISVEYARLLAWSNRYADAARVLRGLAPGERTPGRMLALARYEWWGGDALAADAALDEVLRDAPSDAEALALRADVRRASAPPVELAARWARETDGATEHLLLARALVHAARPAAALAHYQRALERGALADSVLLELASAAVAADSPRVAVRALERYTRAAPADRHARLELAHLYASIDEPARAIAAYDSLLAASDEPLLRFERGRLHAWNDDAAAARRDLLPLASDATYGGPALKLLGDLARWRREWRAARGYYARAAALASPPEGLAQSMEELRRQRRGQLAALLASDPRWRVGVSGFGDTEGMRSSSVEAGGVVPLAGGADATVRVRQGVATGREAGGPDRSPREPRVSAEVGARVPFTGGDVSARAGVSQAEGGPLSTWGVGARLVSIDGGLLDLELERTAAQQEDGAAFAAWLAGATVDRVALAGSQPIGLWTLRSRAAYERFGAEHAGAGSRVGGALALDRALPGPWSASAELSLLGAAHASPSLAGWGPIYWAPELYAAPAASLAYALALGDVHGRFHLSPGLAYVREEGIAAPRYPTGWNPFVGLGFELALRRRAWEVGAAGRWTGGAGRAYRAGGAQLDLSYFPGSH